MVILIFLSFEKEVKDTNVQKGVMSPTDDFELVLFANITQTALMGAKDFRRYDAF